MEGNDNRAGKEKVPLNMAQDIPDEDKAHGEIEINGKGENGQDLSQTDMMDQSEQIRIEKEQKDEEMPEGRPDETAEAEGEKAYKDKDISPELDDISSNDIEEIKTEDQKETTEIEEEGADKEIKPDASGLAQQIKDEKEKPDEETTEREKRPEKKTACGESTKKRKRTHIYIIGLLAATLLFAGIFGWFFYAKEPKPEPIAPPKEDSPVVEKLAKVAQLIQGLQNKQKAISDLTRQYEQGINEAESEILEYIHRQKIATYQDAIKEKRVELCLRSIQRRQIYIEELDQLLDQLILDTEDLIYQKRKIAIDMLMVNVLLGMDMEKLEKRIDTMIQQLIDEDEKLTIDTKDVRPQQLNKIWENIYESRKKRTYVSNEEKTNREIWEEICNGDFSRKHELTALSPEAAKALSEWTGKDLFLGKLTRLSHDEAKYLSTWKGRWLSLNGLTQLTPDAAMYLSQWQGNRLSLNGLKKVSPEVVEYLSQWRGDDLELVSLKNISQWKESGKKVHLPDNHRKPTKRLENRTAH